METLKRLEEQNLEISELCRVLSVLLNDTSVCDTHIARELFQRFTSKVKSHLSLEENLLYSKLLAHKDSRINNITNRFLNNSRELQRIFLDYERQWCREGGKKAKGNDAFIHETHGIFSMITERIKAENEEFFPLANTALA